MATVTWSVLADMNRDGTYEEDLTGYVEKPGPGVALERGLGPDGFMRVSKCSIAFSNRDGRFTAGNSAGAYYGQLDPGLPIQVKANHNSTDYTLWTGYVQRWKRSWRSGAVPLAVAECADLGEYLVNGARVNVTVATNRDTDGALVAIMDAMGLGAGDRDFEDGIQDLPFHFAQAQGPMEAMMAVVRSEMGGWLWVDANGLLRFESRATRLGVAAPDDTWGDGTTVIPVEIEEIFDPLDFVTKASVRTTIFATGQADAEVFRVVSRSAQQPSDNSIALTAGQVYVREFSVAQGVSAFTTPVAETDYLANSAADGSGTDKTSALDVTLTDLGGGRFRVRLENTDAGTIYVTKFRLRGTQTAFYADRPEAVVELSRSDLPAGREVNIDVPFGGDAVYQPVNWAMTVLRTYRWAEARLKLKFRAGHATAATDTAKKDKLLALELGQQIRYIDTTLSAAGQGGVAANGSYTDDWFRVDGLGYHIPPDWAGRDFLVEVTLSPQHQFRNLDAIAFDDFARDNASGDLGLSANGVTWADDSGFDIASGAARANTDTLSMANLDLGTGIVDQVVEAQLAAIGTGDEVGVVLRYTDANNQYRVYLDKGSNEVILEKNVATVVTEIASPAFTVGTSHEVRAMIQGTRIRVWVDFELVIDETDSGLASGTKVGLFARNANATTTFDNFYGQGLDA